ncbi:hypothetical protein HanXRQr2_Chr03g0124541 [Helianthus annuus]|uniref:Uncharacterized protein n=1 Tax=Helianthus annuus TaxID=4232 RepID=A0A9K3NXD9_HELAN|nr:hypothetical protein HanXRQr2_Chr03g0124541 [Helianthus annuus]KAJ0944843.1 hypothetical protein HanPSC8_Chr03g0121281 [Helianthus annuus]
MSNNFNNFIGSFLLSVTVFPNWRNASMPACAAIFAKQPRHTSNPNFSKTSLQSLYSASNKCLTANSKCLLQFAM